MRKSNRRAVLEVPMKSFTQLVGEVSRLRRDFDAHVLTETPQWTQAIAQGGRIEKALTDIKINGVVRDLQGSFDYIAGLLKGPMQRVASMHKWETRVIRCAEWCVRTKFRRRVFGSIALFGLIYGASSVAEDFGWLHQNALKLAWHLTKQLIGLGG